MTKVSSLLAIDEGKHFAILGIQSTERDSGNFNSSKMLLKMCYTDLCHCRATYVLHALPILLSAHHCLKVIKLYSLH